MSNGVKESELSVNERRKVWRKDGRCEGNGKGLRKREVMP